MLYIVVETINYNEEGHIPKIYLVKGNRNNPVIGRGANVKGQHLIRAVDLELGAENIRPLKKDEFLSMRATQGRRIKFVNQFSSTPTTNNQPH